LSEKLYASPGSARLFIKLRRPIKNGGTTHSTNASEGIMKKLLIVLLLATSSAKAQFLSGNELYSSITAAEDYKRLYAMGYVAGVADTGNKALHCINQGVTMGQVFDVAKKYLERNPEIRDFSADSLLTIAFAQAWPCAHKKKGT
jgi:hypothetical protein